jgi:hypothetical protein
MTLSIKCQFIVGLCVLLAVGLGRGAIQRWRDADARARSMN